MERILRYAVDSRFEGRTVYDFLLDQGFSAKNIIYLKKLPESILLNGAAVFVNKRLAPQDELCIRIFDNSASSIEPVPFDLSVLYEDEDLLIVNKPWGMPAIPSMYHHADSLANAVCAYFADSGQNFVYRPVNRLDKNTSGLMLIAKHVISAAMLSTLGAKGGISKTYTAIVTGSLPAQGTIDAPIARQDDSLITRCVDFEKGSRAVTHYRVLEQKNEYALVSVCLETGRTHQIRVHFSHIGHPLAGDDLYGGSRVDMTRHALHAESMSFTQPLTGQQISCHAPMPEDMVAFWDRQSSCISHPQVSLSDPLPKVGMDLLLGASSQPQSSS